MSEEITETDSQLYRSSTVMSSSFYNEECEMCLPWIKAVKATVPAASWESPGIWEEYTHYCMKLGGKWHVVSCWIWFFPSIHEMIQSVHGKIWFSFWELQMYWVNDLEYDSSCGIGMKYLVMTHENYCCHKFWNAETELCLKIVVFNCISNI